MLSLSLFAPSSFSSFLLSSVSPNASFLQGKCDWNLRVFASRNLGISSLCYCFLHLLEIRFASYPRPEDEGEVCGAIARVGAWGKPTNVPLCSSYSSSSFLLLLLLFLLLSSSSPSLSLSLSSIYLTLFSCFLSEQQQNPLFASDEKEMRGEKE